MGITITKKKVETKVSVIQQSDADERVDELAGLLEWEATIKEHPNARRIAELKAELAAEGEKFSPDMEVEIKGSKYVWKLGKQSVTRKLKDGAISMIRQMLGDEAFEQVAQVPLGKIDDYLTKPQREKVLEEGRGGRGGKLLKL